MLDRVNAGGEPRRERSGRVQSIRPNTRTVLAVSLTVVMLLSLLAVPVAGAPPEDAGPSKSAGDNAGGNSGGSSGGGDGGDNAGGNSGGSSGGGDGGKNAGGNSGGSSGGGGGGNNAGDSNAGGDGGNSGNDNAGNGKSGNAADGGGSEASEKSGNPGNGEGANNRGNGNGAAGGSSTHDAPGNSGQSGPPDEGGPPDDRGNSEQSGPPDEAGPPDDRGNSEQSGPPDGAGPGSDGPTVAVSTGSPAKAGGGGPPASPPGQSNGASPASVVDVSVRGAEAGDDVSIDVSPPSVEDEPVAFDGISVRVKRGGEFTMQVTNSREALPGSPDFEPSAAAESLGRVRLGHSISNEEVEDVSFTFRVSKDRLESSASDPESVALYRYSDGEWTALSTDAVGETDSHWVFKARSPGMSEFAIGAKRPAFETYWANVQNPTAETGEGVTVSGRVTNTGGADGVYEASLIVEGDVVETRAVTIAAGGTRQVNFQTDFARAGTYKVAVDDVDAGEVSVDEKAADPVDRMAPVPFQRLLDLGRSLGATVASLASAR